MQGRVISKVKTVLLSILLSILLVVLYLIIGASVPYIFQPQVSEETKETFNPDDCYGQEECSERAMIIEENGDALTERLRFIDNATESIILSTFEFHDDTTGRQVISALMEAAGRGVHVQILVDGASFMRDMEHKPCFHALVSTENVEIKVYNQINLLTPWTGMSRMHDKYLLVDGRSYILGGRNTFDFFLGTQDSHKNYDRDVLVVGDGAADTSAARLKDYFDDIWNQKECRLWTISDGKKNNADTAAARNELKSVYDKNKADNPQWYEQVDYTDKTVSAKRISIFTNPTGLYSKEPVVFYELSELMKNARKDVVIHTPYIICNNYMYDSLTQVCDNVENVTLMTNSVINNGNPFGAADLLRYKDRVLGTGLKLLEFEGEYSYHGKSIAIDNDISVIGSFNMDMKSAYQDTEMMVVIHSEELNSQLRANMQRYEADAHEGVLQPNTYREIFSDDMSALSKFQRIAVWLVDPLFRFLF